MNTMTIGYPTPWDEEDAAERERQRQEWKDEQDPDEWKDYDPVMDDDDEYLEKFVL